MATEAFLVDGIRTAVGKFAGTLSRTRPDDMVAILLRELMSRHSDIDPALISEVVLGCANQAGEDNRNIARMATLLSGLPHTVPAETVNRLCASGLSASIAVARALQLGEGDYYLAGGVESMSRAPFVVAKSEEGFPRSLEVFDTSLGWRFINPHMEELYGVDSMGKTAENLAEQFGISREAQDRYALRSQERYASALGRGFFKDEIFPVEVRLSRKVEATFFSSDEFPRADSSLEKLSSLKPAFAKDGSVTAGNSSGINDGACALLFSSETGLAKLQVSPLARIVSHAAVGVEPRIMGIGPVDAIKRALERAKLTLRDMDHIEINEAFAVQILACCQALGIEADDERLNPNGGAIAIGHPLGMSGARLLLTTARSLKEKGGRYAAVALCVGVGQGVACIIENTN